MGRHKHQYRLSFVTLTLLAAAIAGAPSPAIAATVNGNGMQAVANTTPCEPLLKVRITATSAESFYAGANELGNLVTAIREVALLDCQIQNVTVQKVTYTGYVNGALHYAAAAIPQGGWSRPKLFEIYRSHR